MTVRVIIPVKAPANSKTRLAPVLSPAARAKLIDAMLERVVAAAEAARTVDQIRLLGPSLYGVAARLTLMEDLGRGLNIALTTALAQSNDAARVIILAGDLPQLTCRDVERLAAAPDDTIVIATDRHGTGTNALSLPLPRAQRFTFAFGLGSFASHNREASRLGLKIDAITSPGLAHDIDVPADLRDAADCLQPRQFEPPPRGWANAEATAACGIRR